MALNPVAYTEKVLSSFLRYQLTAYPFSDPELYAQMRALLSLEETRRTPLLRGPYVSLSRSFREGAAIEALVAQGVLHPFMANLIPYPALYGHQEKAVRAVVEGKTVVISTGTGSGKTECFLYPIISRCLQLRDEDAPPGIVAVLIYPMNALAEDQLVRLRGILAGTGIAFGMYVGKTPERRGDVVGQRLPEGSSRADYEAALARARAENRPTGVHPPEERCAREEMRTAGRQPRILITNVKQLELLLTRHSDVELFDGARLEYLVCDEAHTFSGANGAETACLLRRLRTFCDGGGGRTVCVATSATIAEPEEDEATGRMFAERFFGVPREHVVIVGEEYAPDLWAGERRLAPAPAGDPAAHLRAVLEAVDAGEVAPARMAAAFEAMTGDAIDPGHWQDALYDALSANELVYRLAQILESVRALPDLLEQLAEQVGREVSEEEVLTWLALGAASRREGRPLLRPVVHAFVRGVGGAVVTVPPPGGAPQLWLSAEDERAAASEDALFRFPVLNCTTCGQHYFEHFLEDFKIVGGQLGGGRAVAERRYWTTLDRTLGGQRVLLVDRVVGADEDDEPERLSTLYVCRYCGAAHPGQPAACDGCGKRDATVRLYGVPQKEGKEGRLARCISCGATGRTRPTDYREPARPVRAVAVADVHVLAQDMLNHAERRRLLVFADNRQDAAFQAGWMRDHARRFRLRALMHERISRGTTSLGDLVKYMDDVLDADDDLSRALIPEVWNVQRKEDSGVAHGQERKQFLRIQVLRELVTRIKQPIGLEPWGRIKVNYRGIDAEAAFIVRQASAIGVPAADLADGVCALLDVMRRQQYLVFDREMGIFSRFWADGDREIQQGYLPRMPGVPKGLKLRRAPDDDRGRVYQWAAETAHLTLAREVVRSWGVEGDGTDPFLEALWKFVIDEIKVLIPATLRGQHGNALPRCAGTYQIDSDKMTIAPVRELYRCRKCQRSQVRRTPRNRCMGWHCDGELVFEPENEDSYDLRLLDEGTAMLRPQEHSAQVPPDQRERIEYQFKGDGAAVNTLVCTPTLELGVDIGQLDTTLLRNVPPLPANYWQRVGRAGRRHRMAVNVTYARPLSHDQVYFQEPLKILEGAVEPPRFNLRNDLLVRKHVHASILTRLHQLAREGSGLSEFDRNEINETLARMFPVQIRDYLFDEKGLVRENPFDVGPLNMLLTKHGAELSAWVRRTFTDRWPDSDAMAVTPETLAGYVADAGERLNEVIARFRKRLHWAQRQMERLDAERRQRGTLDPADDALYKRCDKLIKILKGQIRRRRAQVEGFDDTHTYAALALEGYLPGYGLDIGSIVATAQLPRYLGPEGDFDLRRPTMLAIREYVPGNLIYANGQRFFPRYFHLEPEDPVYFQIDTARGAVREIGIGQRAGAAAANPGTQGIATEELRAVAMCDVELPHFSHISDEEEFRFQMGVATYGYEQGPHNGGAAYRWGDRDLLHRRGVHLRLLNAGATRLVEKPESVLGYPVCLVCGQSRSPFSSERELEHFHTDHAERCGQPVESTGFYADVIADAISLPGCASREEAFSVLEALRTGAAQILEMETEDLDILVIGHSGSEAVDALLFDPMPGGSGLLDQICERFGEVVDAARALVEHCPSACVRACVDCLLRFRNAFFHQHLNRHLALERLTTWSTVLEFQHEIPSRQPQQATSAAGTTVNQAETALRRMLDSAGFPEGEWQHQLRLGRPLGTTTPDCYYAGDDPEEPGICIYLDGLSRHIHGNPETRLVDQQIRQELRAQGYEVIEIAASDLHDKDRMAGHFYRLARLLMGRERARDIRVDTSWFGEPGAPEAPAANVLPFRKVEPADGDKFRTCVPLISLKAAASGLDESMEVAEQGWVEPTTNRRLGPDMFVAQVVGHSMEPRIPDGAYCLFRSPVVGSRTGRILLVQHRDIDDPETGGSYTVKKFDSSEVTGKEGTDRRGTIYLRPVNPAYDPIALTDVPEEEINVIAELIDVL
jgi:ATP-dependent helicase YprA (DUF1998 family)/SOS-response transcriptional repressor LexA